jgi:hypothetical protein
MTVKIGISLIMNRLTNKVVRLITIHLGPPIVYQVAVDEGHMQGSFFAHFMMSMLTTVS